MDELLPGDVILADRRFTVHEVVGTRNANLRIPDLTK